MRRTSTVTLVFLALASAGALAADGDLDQTFGVGGKVWTDLGDDAVALDASIQSDDKVSVVGRAGDDLLLARYDTDGSLDAGFGSGGIVRLSVVPGDVWSTVLARSDGTLIAGGSRSGDVLLMRFLSDGSLDAGFGIGGTVVSDLGGFEGVSLLAEGPGGTTLAVVGPNVDLTVARYDGAGNLDAGFGSAGVVTTNVGFTGSGAGLMVQTDGKIVAGLARDFQLAIARYDAGGALDGSFGTGGVLVPTSFGPAYGVQRFVLQPDGEILSYLVRDPVVNERLAVGRHHADGSLDASFGDGGVVETFLTTYEAEPGFVSLLNARTPQLIVQSDGKIVAAGRGGALLRLDPDGSLDTTFGACGIGVTTIAGEQAALNALVQQSDGRLIAVGTTGEMGPGTRMVGLARFGSPSSVATCQPAAAAASKVLVKGFLFKWTWKSSSDVVKEDFGDPLLGEDVAVCAIRPDGRVVLAVVGGGGTECGGRPCWREGSKGFLYAGKDFDGFYPRKLKIKESSGVAGKAKLVVRATTHAPAMSSAVPSSDWLTPIIVRMQRGDGSACSEATFSSLTQTDKGLTSVLRGTSD
jgi:uncharacterized delta-60 repeat protein